jgi:cbb3-type cytochrome oxidase maturation protein
MVGPEDAAGMSVIVLLIIAGGAVAAAYLAAFVWAVRTGQFDDTCTPAVRVLLDERSGPPDMARLAAHSPAGTNRVPESKGLPCQR